jgi:hypothetical protein
MKKKSRILFYPFAIIMVIFLMLQNSCSTDDSSNTPNPSGNLPVLTTIAASSITLTSASSGGSIITNGGSAVTSRGLCWSTTKTSPTISDNKTTDGSGSGSFTSNLSNLNHSTTYYIRAYATNLSGTAYGNPLNFETLKPPPGDLEIIVVKSGNQYGGAIVYLYNSASARSNDPARTKYLCKSTTGFASGAMFYELPVAQYFIYCTWTDGSQTLTGTSDVWVVSETTTPLTVQVQ